jgi:hypothetical protein
MGEVSLWAKILVPILIFGGLIWKEGGLEGVFESYRDQYRQWGLRGTLWFLLAFAAWVLFMTWVTS